MVFFNTGRKEEFMGLRYRKSINIGGGFRVNISKSGIGYSWGVPGYRVTKTATGKTRKTYSIPGTGISYVKEGSKKQQNKPSSSPQQNTTVSSNTKNTVVLSIGSVSDYQTEEYLDFIKAIKNYKTWNLISNILVCTIIFAGIPFFIFTALLGIVLKIFTKVKLSIPIEYELDDTTKTEYENKCNSLMELNRANYLWQLTSTSAVVNTKVTAGADNIVSRQKIRISKEVPNFLKSNVVFVCLHLKKEQLYFMPDKLLLVQGSKVGAISYDKIKLDKSDYSFIEGEYRPVDAEQKGTTWLKVNKNGSPDKRYKNNRQIPIYNYGLIKLSTDSGMDLRICCSNRKLAKNISL